MLYHIPVDRANGGARGWRGTSFARSFGLDGWRGGAPVGTNVPETPSPLFGRADQYSVFVDFSAMR